MQKIAAAKLIELGPVIIFTDKPLKEINDSEIKFEDGSFVNGKTGEYKFVGSPDSYQLVPSSEEDILKSIQRPGVTINSGKMPELVIYKLDASVTQNLNWNF